MLRNDTIYLSTQDCDSKIPSKDVIIAQARSTSPSSWIPARLRLGKVTLGQYEDKNYKLKLKRKKTKGYSHTP